MTDTKNIIEALKGLEVIAVAGNTILQDGRVDLADFPKLADLVKNINVLVKTVKGIKQMPNEVKDLNDEEARAILKQVLTTINAIKTA